MTRSTKRRVFVSLIVVALTLPAELVLLDALTIQDSRTAARQWVSGLSSTEVDRAAGKIQGYPYVYRVEILAALSPEARSAVWRQHIRTYVRERPDLSSDAIPVLDAAIEAAAPATFSGGLSSADREQLRLVADQVVAVVGQKDAEYLLHDLGPKDGTFASLEPFRQKLANSLRAQVVALAQEEWCDCATYYGCYSGGYTHCENSQFYCEETDEWPACGWFWGDPCDGLCTAGY